MDPFVVLDLQSCLSQAAAEGTSYGIVPFMNKKLGSKQGRLLNTTTVLHMSGSSWQWCPRLWALAETLGQCPWDGFWSVMQEVPCKRAK